MRCLYGLGVLVLIRRFHFSRFHLVDDSSRRVGFSKDPLHVHDFRHARLSDGTRARTRPGRVYRAFSRLDPQRGKPTIGTKRFLLLPFKSLCMGKFISCAKEGTKNFHDSGVLDVHELKREKRPSVRPSVLPTPRGEIPSTVGREGRKGGSGRRLMAFEQFSFLVDTFLLHLPSLSFSTYPPSLPGSVSIPEGGCLIVGMEGVMVMERVSTSSTY